MSRLIRFIVALAVAASTLYLPAPVNAAPLRVQLTTARLDGIPAVGGTLSVDLASQPKKSTATYKWVTSTGTLLAKTKSFTVPITVNVMQSIRVTVVNSAAGYSKWTYESPWVSLGFVNILKTGKAFGNAKVGLPYQFEPDETLPQIQGRDGNIQVTQSEYWTIGGRTFPSSQPRTITPTPEQRGQMIVFTTLYQYPGLANMTVNHHRDYIYGLLTMTSTGSLSSNTWVGQTVSLVANPTYSEQQVDRLGFQWYRDGKAITGQEKSTYKLTKTDLNHRISLIITGWPSGDYLRTVTELTIPRILAKAPKPNPVAFGG